MAKKKKKKDQRFEEGRCYECGRPRQIGAWCRKCFRKLGKK